MSKRRSEAGERLRVSLKVGRHFRLRADLRATPAGIATFAGLLSAALVSGAVVAATAVAATRRPAPPPYLPPLRRD